MSYVLASGSDSWREATAASRPVVNVAEQAAILACMRQVALLIRNQQVTRSSRVAGSSFPQKIVDPDNPIVAVPPAG